MGIQTKINMALLKKTEYGHKRGNPLACRNNAVKLPACNTCKTSPYCEDYGTFDIPDGVLIQGFYYSEVDAQIDFAEPVSVEDFEFAYCNAVQNCLTEKGMSNFEIGIRFHATTEGTTTTFSHIGQTTVEYIILDDGTKIPLERRCNLITVGKLCTVVHVSI